MHPFRLPDAPIALFDIIGFLLLPALVMVVPIERARAGDLEAADELGLLLVLIQPAAARNDEVGLDHLQTEAWRGRCVCVCVCGRSDRAASAIDRSDWALRVHLVGPLPVALGRRRMVAARSLVGVRHSVPHVVLPTESQRRDSAGPDMRWRTRKRTGGLDWNRVARLAWLVARAVLLARRYSAQGTAHARKARA